TAFPASQTAAQGTSYCSDGQSPAFTPAMQALASVLGDAVGTPVECEHIDVVTGSARQQTSSGVAYYDPPSGAPSFTNGSERWLLAGDGTLQYVPGSLSATQPVSSPADPCDAYAPYDGPAVACVLAS